MANYIIIDAWTGYIWGDTRNIGGKTSAIETAQSKLAIQLPVPEKTLDFDFGL